MVDSIYSSFTDTHTGTQKQFAGERAHVFVWTQFVENIVFDISHVFYRKCFLLYYFVSS